MDEDPIDEVDAAWVVEEYEQYDDPPETHGWAITTAIVLAILLIGFFFL